MDEDKRFQEVVGELKKVQLEIALENRCTEEQLKAALAAKINYLVTNNFSLLISILYRLDISEKKLKELLAVSTNVPAGNIIATMVIERQLQKIASRKKFSMNSSDINEDEKW